jgi:hypothetical protein
MSNSAMIGAAVGFAWALLDYFVLLPLIVRPLEAGVEAAPRAERPRLEGRIRLIRTVFALSFLAFPVVGYFIGGALAPAGTG